MPALNPIQTRRNFEKAAKTYDAAALLQQEIGQRLHERLDYIKIAPEHILDLGCGTGFITKKLLMHYPKANILSLDIAVNMLKETRKAGGWFRKPRLICADANHLPLSDKSVDLLVSNLMLQWCPDLQQVFSEIMRVMKPGGMILFSTFGPDTLKEFRESWSRVDGYAHTTEFIDMHDVGDTLMQAGFSQPVMDMEMITMTYDKVRLLMHDLKQIGARNTHPSQCKGLTGKQRLKAFETEYEHFRQNDGLYPATYEVVYGHAWVPENKVKSEGIEHFIPITPV
jgi:malonyl-CoA O-methyltransferase